MSMQRTPPFLSLTQIHNVYTPEFQMRPPANQEKDVVYTRISFSGREPGHPGHPPLLPESAWKKSRR